MHHVMHCVMHYVEGLRVGERARDAREPVGPRRTRAEVGASRELQLRAVRAGVAAAAAEAAFVRQVADPLQVAHQQLRAASAAVRCLEQAPQPRPDDVRVRVDLTWCIA